MWKWTYLPKWSEVKVNLIQKKSVFEKTGIEVLKQKRPSIHAAL